MTRDSRAFSPSRAGRPRSEAAYAGTLGKTRLETVHWTLSSGELASVRVHTTVNVTSDPALGERLLSGDLNWVQPAGSDELQQVLLPLVYHDEERQIFALVLPEAYRSRELDERAALLKRLAAESGHPVPVYVVQFHVVYGSAGLAELLARESSGGAPAEGSTELERREDEIVTREAKLAEWEARLEAEQKKLALDLKQRQLLDQDINTALQVELRKREGEITRREAELREVERLVMEHQTELDRREAQMLRQPMPEPGETDSPTRVANRESLELAAREKRVPTEEADLLEGPAPRAAASIKPAAMSHDEELRKAQRELQARLGSSFPVTSPDEEPPHEGLSAEDDLAEGAAAGDDDLAPHEEWPAPGEEALGEPSSERSADPEGRRESEPELAPGIEAELASDWPAEESHEDLDDVWGEEGGGDTGTAVVVDPEAEEPPRRRSQKTVASPLDEALLGAVAEEAQKTKALLQEEDAVSSFLGEESDADGALAAEEPALPEELSDWYEDEQRGPRWYTTDSGAHLAVCLPAADAEAFVGVEPQGLLQLHGFDSFAWVTIAVVASSGDDAPSVIHWPLDVRDNRARALLDRLAVDFRFALEIYDDLLEPVTSQELHYPLEENVRVVRDRAQQWLDGIPADALDPVAAWERFQEPDFPRLEPGAPEFHVGSFQALGSAREVSEAVSVVAHWSGTEKEDELLLRRSFPAAAWRSLRLRVLRAAIEFGIWMDEGLRRMALDAGYATSKRDLLRACLTGFERVGAGELQGGLDPEHEHENWRAMLAEADRLGVAVEPRWERMADEALRRMPSDPDLDLTGERDPVAYTDQLERLDEADLLEADDLSDHVDEAIDDPDGGGSDDEAPASPRRKKGRSPQKKGKGRARGRREEPADEPPGEVNFGELGAPELIVMLSDPESRLGAALELCVRGERRALPELFDLLAELEPSELLRIGPPLVGFGAEAVSHFQPLLRSSVSHLRILSALALGALGAEVALDGLIDLLLDEPTEHWRSVAAALGDFGRPAMMSLASRIRHSSGEQRTRIASALAEVSLQEGCRELLLDLSGSRDEEAAMLAVEALRQAAELRMAREGAPRRDQPVARFTGRLLDVLAGPEREVDEGDIIEADDIVEEGEVDPDDLEPESPRR